MRFLKANYYSILDYINNFLIFPPFIMTEVNDTYNQDDSPEFNNPLLERFNKPWGALEIILDILENKITQNELKLLFYQLSSDDVENFKIMIECFQEEYEKRPDIIEVAKEHLRIQASTTLRLSHELLRSLHRQN